MACWRRDFAPLAILVKVLGQDVTRMRDVKHIVMTGFVALSGFLSGAQSLGMVARIQFRFKGVEHMNAPRVGVAMFHRSEAVTVSRPWNIS
jgi:hypothetical protein